MNDPVLLRPFDPSRGDADFVVGTFQDSLRAELPWRLTDVRRHRYALERLLRDPRTRCLVAEPRGTRDNDLLGWACEYEGVLIYAYTRPIVHGAGVFTRLWRALGEPRGLVYYTRHALGSRVDGHGFYFAVEMLATILGLVKTQQHPQQKDKETAA